MFANCFQGYFRNPLRLIRPDTTLRSIRVWINQAGYYDI